MSKWTKEDREKVLDGIHALRRKDIDIAAWVFYRELAVTLQCELNEARAMICEYEELRSGRSKCFPDFFTVSRWLSRNRSTGDKSPTDSKPEPQTA